MESEALGCRCRHASHDLIVHVARTCAWSGRRSLLLRKLSDHCLGGNEKASRRSRVLQRCAYDLGRVDDALRDQVAELAGLSIESVVIGLLTQSLQSEYWIYPLHRYNCYFSNGYAILQP
jgi:hypothetical protein